MDYGPFKTEHRVDGMTLIRFPEGEPTVASNVEVFCFQRIAELEARVGQLRVALGWFVADERFTVGVGGNPNVVEPMIAEAMRIYECA